MLTLGVVVFSLRGMKHLARCLESVQWADSVVVVHAGDGEPSFGANPDSSFVLRKVVSTQEVRQLAHEIKTDWILHLWGEERVEGELRDELRLLCKTEVPRVPSCYRIPIRSHLLGRWVEGSLWGPSPALRLSREVEEFSPGWWSLPERTMREAPGLLRGWIGDYSSVDLSDGVDRVDDLSSLWAKQLQEKGCSISLAVMVVTPLRVFMRSFFKKGVFFLGLAGLTLSILAAYATLLAGAKTWEAKNVRQIAK